MPLTSKSKPGLLGRLFNKDKPQPSSPISVAEKTLGQDGEVLDVELTEPKATKGLFSSRRSKASKPLDVVDVSIDEAIPLVKEEPTLDTATSADIQDASVSSAIGAEQVEIPATSNEPTPAAVGKTERARGFFNKTTAAKSKSENTPKPSKKTPKQKKRGKGDAAALDKITLLTELGDSGKQLLWVLTAESLTQVVAAPTKDVVSFSKDDIRMHADAGMSYAKALDMAIEEVGELVAVVNRSKDLNSVFCTREERATGSGYRIAPGEQALNALLKRDGKTGQGLVAGFQFKDSAGTSSVVVLYAISAEGGSSKPQITVNPDNMEFVLSQFTSSRKINRKETELVLYSNADFLSVSADFSFFADEKVWNGIPVRRIYNVAAVATGVVAAGALSWAGIGFAQAQLLTAQVSSAKAQSAELLAQNNKIISASVGSFAKQLSQDQAQVFRLAQQVWVPSSKVTAEASGDTTKLTVVLPLEQSVTFNNGPSVYAVTSPVRVQDLYAKSAPEGCKKGQPQTNGNLNEIRIEITCQSLDSAFSRYRSD